jgi:hypothetical protein
MMRAPLGIFIHEVLAFIEQSPNPKYEDERYGDINSLVSDNTNPQPEQTGVLRPSVQYDRYIYYSTVNIELLCPENAHPGPIQCVQ